MTKRTTIEDFVKRCLAAWYTSGKVYTCAAVVYDVIDPVARQLCDDTTIRPRQVANLAFDYIHKTRDESVVTQSR